MKEFILVRNFYNDGALVFVSLVCIFLIYFFNFKSLYLLTISLFTISFFRIFLHKVSLISCICFFVSCLCVFPYLDQRFILIQIIFPIIFGLCFYFDSKYRFIDFGVFKSIFFIFLIITFLLIYGVLSEIYKLNKYWGRDYDIEYVFLLVENFDILYDWIANQLYRVMQIWVHLSSNMIEYFNSSDFLYMQSLFKTLLGHETRNIPLPELSAQLINAFYAQPGAFGEGYANLGLAGAYLNLIVMFFIIEVMVWFFLKERNLFWFIMMITPFTKILLDGGTIISSIVIATITFFMNFSILKKEGIK